MSATVPGARPKLTRADALRRVLAAPLTRGERTRLLLPNATDVSRPLLLGIRGYYLDSMGAPGVNDRGVYDDALCLLTPGGHFAAWNGNTDPSRAYRENLATLVPGLWWFSIGLHRGQYLAFRQATEVVVHRDGTEGEPVGVTDERGKHLGGGRWAGWFGINGHCGGDPSTGSAGCQTWPPSQWADAFRTITGAMKAAGVDRLPYLLTEEPPRG